MAFASKLASANIPADKPLDAPDVQFKPGHFGADADSLLGALLAELELRPDELVIGGQMISTKRLHDFRADAGKSYHYSGGQHHERSWTPVLLSIKDRVETAVGARFNACLCNYYQDGNVGMGWHADKEMELGDKPTIASVSFGAERLFRFRRRLPWRSPKTYEKWNFQLKHGDLLVMRGETQRYFEHELAPQAKIAEPRLNLTFRLVLGARPLNAAFVNDL